MLNYPIAYTTFIADETRNFDLAPHGGGQSGDSVKRSVLIANTGPRTGGGNSTSNYSRRFGQPKIARSSHSAHRDAFGEISLKGVISQFPDRLSFRYHA
jgi:hypothetical protein